MTKVEKDARGSKEDNMKPTTQCAEAAAVRAYWAAIAYYVNHYSEIQINQKKRRAGRKESRYVFFLFFTYAIKLPSPAPFSMGSTFFRLVVPYCDLPTEH